jgi:hypothetical protein
MCTGGALHSTSHLVEEDCAFLVCSLDAGIIEALSVPEIVNTLLKVAGIEVCNGDA